MRERVRTLAARFGPKAQPVAWLCGAHLFLAFLLFDPKPFLGGDNYWYMLLADSLRSGEGYRDLWLPAMPPHTRYPPVYPVALAILGFLANSPILFKLLSVASTTGITALVFLLARDRTGDKELALLAGFLATATPILVEYSHWVLSEPAFTFLLMLAIYAFTRDWEGKSVRLFALGTAAALLAGLTRSAGYPLILAIVIALAARRDWKGAAIFLGATVVVMGAWWLRNRLAVSGDLPYSQWILFRDPYRPELGTVTAAEMFARFFDNVKVYTLSVLPRSLGGRDLSNGMAGTYGVILAVPILAGALRHIKKLGVAELFFVFYMGLVLLWPQAWSDQRLLLPVLPVVIVLLLEGSTWIARAVAKTEQRTALVGYVVGAILVGVAVLGNMRVMGEALGCSRQYWAGNHYACYPQAMADFIDVAIWTQQGTPPDAIVVNRKPQIFYWYARRRGDNYPYTTDPDSMMSFMDSQEASYVVVDNWSATTYRYLIPAIQANSERFGLAHQQGNPPTYLLTYRGGSGR